MPSSLCSNIILIYVHSVIRVTLVSSIDSSSVEEWSIRKNSLHTDLPVSSKLCLTIYKDRKENGYPIDKSNFNPSVPVLIYRDMSENVQSFEREREREDKRKRKRERERIDLMLYAKER